MAETARHSDTRRHILRAALKHFANSGYAAASVQQIVDAARVSKPALYYHFKDKAALFQALVDEAHDKEFELLRKAAARGGALKGRLAHVHISENDRSTPGSGNVRWAENFDAIKEIGYNNLMVVEAFGLALKRLIPATKIWRRMYQNERQLAGDALKFMKAEVAKRWK